MSFNRRAPAGNNPPPEFTNNQGGGPNDNVPRNAGWLRGFRVDSIDEPQISAYQVAAYLDGAVPFVEEMKNLSTETIITKTTRDAHYVHRGWSVGAVATISPWTSSRIAANNQPNPEGIWYTKLTKTRQLRIQVLPEDLVPTPEFEAAIKDALRRPTAFEQFHTVYRTLARWGDVLPLEIEMGSSLALTDTEMDRLQLPETGEHNYSNIAGLSAARTTDLSVIGCELRWSDGRWSTIADPQWQVIKVCKVVPTISLLTSDLQMQLSELYAQRLSYIPSYGIGLIRNWHKTYDDNQYASKTISSITIRSSDYIELLSVTYADGTTSSNHGGGGHVGTYYKFALATGEHIIEMLTWIDGDWLLGLQFVTNMGRCSPQYGVHHDTPSVAKVKGGVLVGFLSRTKDHPEYREMFSSVQGIWRHDVLPRVPKEDDVYSEYFGDRHSDWSEHVFNDRPLVGNSNSIHISSVQVWSGDSIESIQFTYTDNKSGQEFKCVSLRHGGPGGSFRQLVLEDGEHIVTVSGRHGEHRITQLCFGTNRGRTSEVYGAGQGQSFSSLAPRDQDGNYFRLQYICGKNSDTSLTGMMFVWTPC
ncbi:unnamed protein product [Rhizoctonia solani]|uniref:Jacalin-type lectin domain-containing protein n=1 Tax=Rhizoctonia solani TaxID=456999 RepID=A0A8H3C6A5_9AGAM|nr:unnamed protein product [Rhizoctonia solani]